MKYLIIKGWLGFGDRLEHLKTGIKYALESGRSIYVDWRDDIWTRDEKDFYTYFELKNINQISSLSEIPDEVTVYPEYWKTKFRDPVNNQVIEDHKKESLDIFKDLQNGKLEHDVVVYGNFGVRSLFPDSKFFADVFRVKDSIVKQEVLRRIQQYNLQNCWGIHLRGTDRAPPTRAREFKLQRVRQLSAKLVMHGVLGGASLIGVSDDPEYVTFWNNRFKGCPILTRISVLGGTEGTHNMKDTTITKHEMNQDLLIDFFTLGSCKKVFSTSQDSRFALEAQRLHNWIDIVFS